MSIKIFNKKEFEAAIPHKWECLGLVDGEYNYLMEINSDIFIMIRSSVGSSGFCGDTGKDSIRAWLVDADLKPLGSKVSRWITRVAGWEERLIITLRQLWNMAKFAGYCNECQIPNGVFIVKKKGKNKGKIFKKCTQCENNWEWMS